MKYLVIPPRWVIALVMGTLLGSELMAQTTAAQTADGATVSVQGLTSGTYTLFTGSTIALFSIQ